MKAETAKRNRSALEWGILPQAPWDLALTGQDWRKHWPGATPDQEQSRQPGRRSGYVPVEPCPSSGCNQYTKGQK